MKLRPLLSAPWAISLVSLASLTMAAGCGGSSSKTGAEATRSASVSLNIRWPEQTRLIPVGAQSIAIELRDSAGALLLPLRVIPRPTSGSTSTVVFNNLSRGDIVIKASAYPTADGTGVAQARGTIGATLVSGQTTAAALTMDSTIDRVEIYSPGTLSFTKGGRLDLFAIAYNSAGESVFVDNSQWEWSISNGTDFSFFPSGDYAGVESDAIAFTYVTLRDKESGKTTTVPVFSHRANSDKIIFTSNRDGDEEIYSMSADGSGVQRLTSTANRDDLSILSPDGSKIAYACQPSSDGEVCMMNTDGSGQVNITNTAFNDQPFSFSPDSKKVAMMTNRYLSGGHEIATMNLDGTGVTRITNNTNIDDATPMFSPDGKKILFTSKRNNNTDIYIVNADGTGETRLTTDPKSDESPMFSPDGKKIVFTSFRNTYNEIYTMNIDGTNQTRLTNANEGNYNPIFSPDGKKILFVRAYYLFTRDICIMDADGSNFKRLTNNSTEDTRPTFSPDGQSILFEAYTAGKGELYKMNLDGTGLINLTNNPASDSYSSWLGSRNDYNLF
jgi:Tol biopolymer transport system component